MITIVDTATGNVGALARMLRKLRRPARVTDDPDQVASADCLIAPGVGHTGTVMAGLKSRGLDAAIREAAASRKRPVLGICVGMQILADHCEEGDCPGLGLVPGRCVRFSASAAETPIRIPNMGWKPITVARENTILAPLFDDPDQGPEPWRFYFVHSYHFVCEEEGDVLGLAHHGGDFTAAIARDNIVGVQFHPEKSLKYGMAFLDRFAEWAGEPRA